MMKFEKYHGLGNDFIIVDYQSNIDYCKLAISLCNRNLGIGADGLIVVRLNPYEMIFFNQDGSRASMCGNGIRCFAAYCLNNKLIENNYLEVNTLAGLMKIEVLANNYRVNMGHPIFTKEAMKLTIPFCNKLNIIKEEVFPIFMATIHTVVFKNDLSNLRELEIIGQDLVNHHYFQEKTNVNFVKIISKDEIEVLTYERGVGFTLACGSGACAAAIISNKYFNLSNKIKVKVKHGFLLIEIKEAIYMSGPAVRICKGEIDYV